MENTIRLRRTALALGIAFLATLGIGTTRAAEAQASLPPAPGPDAEMGPTKIFVAIWASDISKIDRATDNRTDLARIIDRRCRILFPLTFVGASAAIFLR